jgi:hypothetical protein
LNQDKKIFLLHTMKDEFELPVVFDKKTILRQSFCSLGTPINLKIDVNGIEVLFEPDEERNYRAWIDPTKQEALIKVNPHLLKEIALAIESIVK